MNPEDLSFMRESWVMKFPDTYSSFLNRSGYAGWDGPTCYAQAVIFQRRKQRKRMAVHADCHYGQKQKPEFHTKLSYISSSWKARLSSIYDTFRENVGSGKNMIFIGAGFIYRVRKGQKRYTYPFVRNYAKGWGYELR
jgi:hypothetical protein